MAIQAFTPIVGGGELQLERLLEPLAARGIEARVVTRAVGGTPAHDQVRGAQVVRTRVAGESPLASIVYVLSALLELVRRRRRTAVVHAHGALSPATIALGATFLGIPAVVTPLGAGAPGDLARVQRKPGGRWRLRALVRRAHFVALSDELARELQALGVPSTHLHEVPNGFDARVFHPPTAAERARARQRIGLQDGCFAFVFVGRLHPVKNVDLAIRALASVDDAELLVVGDGPERAALERVTAEVGVRDRVRFTGTSDRAHEYLHGADAFVLPSRAEGMSNALVEAMACALPCLVTSSISGVDRLIGHDRGVVVAAGDRVAWTAAMDALRIDRARARRLGDAAAAHVHDTFSLDRTADRLATLYREIASR
jgi:glycosyltransferase involved in cell wall biosynthesis